ncbi:MAG: HAD-IIIC family phosphatase [Candidatus Nitrohelix vancouverensis]|uniref:HAD-IIIC family phosphatase n=1 Tax=Candidatus Nitrohelix vancouverensis TaxID=2705534 RepID=A0A7T0C299_9BACT|nr:MAG: HAD-IIIC family phosphatase [Candidatus Nitrohelix vancouverensis]
MLNDFLRELFTGKLSQALQILEQAAKEPVSPASAAMLRLAILQPGHTFMSYQRLFNIWSGWGKPELKPNAVRKKAALITDFTADHFGPMISLFAAAQGVQVETYLPGFDSIEQSVLDPKSPLYENKPDIALLFFSERWLKRYTGSSSLSHQSDLEQAQNALSSLVQALETHSDADILIGNLPGPAYALPGGMVARDELMGWNLAVSRFNEGLTRLSSRRVRVVDLAGAMFSSGGRQSMGRSNYLRARMAYEMQGALAAARELASGIAHVCGKTHRALVSDWDNTLWGGEVAELGSFGVVCGQDSPDALGYYMIQEYLKALPALGVLLAGMSRNDPAVKSIFDDNKDLPLVLNDFASTQLGWNPKSDGISQISKELGFGPEFMVFMDDSLYEIAQVMSMHPYIDVLWAGPDAQGTLERLSQSRLFNAISLSDEDLQRGERAVRLKEQREFKASFANIEEFLSAIQVTLTFVPVNDGIMDRVGQLFQKTNQFNLTTRRHRENDLKRMMDDGAAMYAVSYEDSFGSQGIIAVVNLISDECLMTIESWLMSCRVLNRTVEQAIFSFILGKAEGRRVRGEFRPTEKNGLVKSLYSSLGFSKTGGDDSETEIWLYDPQAADATPPKHFTTIKEL